MAISGLGAAIAAPFAGSFAGIVGTFAVSTAIARFAQSPIDRKALYPTQMPQSGAYGVY
jgi:hypothetical protein